MNSRRERTGLESTGCMVAFIPGGVEQAVGPLVPYCAGPQVDPHASAYRTRKTCGSEMLAIFPAGAGFENRCVRVQSNLV
jgi:hypothetical protein